MILATEASITSALKIIWVNTKVILTTNKQLSATEKYI